jgi:hypothetical protein
MPAMEENPDRQVIALQLGIQAREFLKLRGYFEDIEARFERDWLTIGGRE